MLKVCLTFDIDLTNYIDNMSMENEFDEILCVMMPLFHLHPAWKVTWFIRLDKQIESLFGQVDYLFIRYADEIVHLRRMGHEIGWHPHCYKLTGGEWHQNTDVNEVLEELQFCIPYVQKYGIKAIRIGWGWQHNQVLALLESEGFKIDSSAVPRPKYKWEETERDWSITPKFPYFPSSHDYRIPGEPHRDILEVPMSVTRIPAPYDTQEVERYINLSFHSSVLEESLAGWIKDSSLLVSITHPYELVPNNNSHPLISYSIDVFESNVKLIESLAQKFNKEVEFVTISELAESFSRLYAS